MSRFTFVVSLVLLQSYSPWALAEPPTRPLSTFGSAKKIARDVIHAGNETTFYCGCSFTRNKTGSGGRIDATDCGYKPRKNPKRGAILEWEHIVPAYFFGHTRACWAKGHAECVRSDGKVYKGRSCCGKVDEEFKRMEADLHNLAPAVGEINGDRSNLPYGVVEGEARKYGQCDFEIGGKPRKAEPREVVRGDAARVWLYMSDTYNIKLSKKDRTMFESWSKADPPDDWERLRDLRIEAAQGNRNPHVIH